MLCREMPWDAAGRFIVIYGDSLEPTKNLQQVCAKAYEDSSSKCL